MVLLKKAREEEEGEYIDSRSILHVACAILVHSRMKTCRSEDLGDEVRTVYSMLYFAVFQEFSDFQSFFGTHTDGDVGERGKRHHIWGKGLGSRRHPTRLVSFLLYYSRREQL